MIAEAWEIHPKRARKLEGAARCDASRLDLIIEEQKGGQPLQGHQFGSQGAVPAGRLDCPFRAVDGFRHLAGLECDNSESCLAAVLHADITERLGQDQRLFEEGPRCLQIHDILAHCPRDHERIGQ